MRSEQELRAVARSVEQLTAKDIARGAPARPSTMLEAHAFELGRLSVLRWILKDAEEVKLREPGDSGGLSA